METDDKIAAFRQYLLARRLSAETARSYCIHLNKFLKFLGSLGIKNGDKPDRPLVEKFRESVQDSSQSSRKQVDSALRCWFGMLVSGGSMLANPMDGIRSPKMRRLAQKPTLTPEETDRLLAVPPVDTPLGVRNRAIIETLYSTAIRKKEMLGLSVYDVDLREGFVWVRKGKGGKDRKVPLGKTAGEWLRRYIEFARPRMGRSQASSGLFLSRHGNSLKGGEVARLIHAAADKAGINNNVTPHVFRHTAATEMVRNGAELRYVQEYLGHEHLKTTQIYTRVTNPDLKAMILRCHPSAGRKFKAPVAKFASS